MTSQSFLKSQLQADHKYELSSQDKKLIEKEGLESYIFRKLTSKKFRRWKLQDETRKQIQGAIKIAVDNNQPLKVVFPMGAYKLWRLPTSPEADWAEFFNISHLISFVSTVAAGYKPGVDLIYYMHTLLMEIHDNLTTEEINSYISSFEKLVKYFGPFLPKNVKITISKDADFYPREEYFQTLEDNFDKGKALYSAFDEKKKLDLQKLGELNIKWKGREDWTKLTDDEKQEKIRKGAIYETVATSALDRVMKNIKGPDKVLIFVKNGGIFMGIGSCKNSIAKFWVGTGIVEKNGSELVARILTPSQFEKVKGELRYERIDLLDIQNLGKIGIYDGKLNFLSQ